MGVLSVMTSHLHLLGPERVPACMKVQSVRMFSLLCVLSTERGNIFFSRASIVMSVVVSLLVAFLVDLKRSSVHRGSFTASAC